MWDKVIEACVTLLQNDSELSTLLGGPRIYRNRSLPTIQTPGVFWLVVSSTLEENYAPCRVQWDIFAKDMDTVQKIELRLFQLMHSDLPVTFGTLRTWSRFDSGHDIPELNETIAHRAVDYVYTPAREEG